MAGGSGACSIISCNRSPEMTSVIIDIPKVVEVAQRYVDEAGLSAPIRFIAIDARGRRATRS
jgi:hypothetical protein